MDKDNLNRWLTFAANVGVLGGLILVAVQINQNTEITKAQLANDYFIADMQLELAMMGENPAESWIKAVYSPDEMTREDAAVVDRYFNYGLVQIIRLRQMHRLGLADEAWANQRVSYLEWHLGNEVGRRCWDFSKQTYSKEFVQIVDNALAQGDFTSNQNLLESMMPAAENIRE